MQRLEAVYGRVLEALALVACALILGMTLMICADVLLRNVRLVPGLAGLEWANEISEHDPRLAGVRGVLGKPLDLERLRALLSDLEGPAPASGERHASLA